jgi:hypothetical protein
MGRRKSAGKISRLRVTPCNSVVNKELARSREQEEKERPEAGK